MDASVAHDLPLVATFASPVPSGQHALVYGVIAAVATGYGIARARRFGAAAVIQRHRVRTAHVTVVSPVFGAILDRAAAIGVALGWTQPYWVPEPILLLALYVLIGKRDRIGERRSALRSARPPRSRSRSSRLQHGPSR